MIWLDNIQQLQWYNLAPGDPCYCELLLQPSDLLLQGQISGIPSPTLKVYCYSVDGLTNLGDVTQYFDHFFFSTASGTFFNLIARRFAPGMCSNKCFILRVIVESDSVDGHLFNRYTEQYCLHGDCCVIATSVTINGTTTTVTDPASPGGGTVPTRDGCGRPLLTIRTVFDCYDRINGDFYGLPANPTGGTTSTPFAFEKVTHIVGAIKRQPREITRQISQNCRAQKVQSARRYEVRGWEQFPLWKMDELEGMLHANHIYVGGREYVYRGDTPFERMYACKDFFRLKVALEDCTLSQVFGCSTECDRSDSGARYFGMRVAPSPDRYYDEAGRFIGEGFAKLLNWFRNQAGVTAVEDVRKAGAPPHYKIFSVKGAGYIPTYFYAGERSRRAKIMGRGLDPAQPDYNALLGLPTDILPCHVPSLGIPEIHDYTCAVPDLGTPIIEEECLAPRLGKAIIEEEPRY